VKHYCHADYRLERLPDLIGPPVPVSKPDQNSLKKWPLGA